MIDFSKKTSRFNSSLIREMTILANKTGAINLAQGFPEFAPPKELLNALLKVTDSVSHQYSENYGVFETRQTIAEKRTKEFGFEIGADEILLTCGSTEAMAVTYLALFDKGDKIGTFDPFYGSYLSNALLTESEIIFTPLTGEKFDIDQKALEDVFKQGIKAFVLCNPSNPTGKVFTRDELLNIAELAEKYDVIIITDEVYEHMVFYPNEHIYFASLPGMYKRTISISSLSKTFSITGWRLGFITAQKEIVDNIRKFHDLLTVCSPTPLQIAAVTALRFGDEYYHELIQLYGRKKGILLGGLDELGISHSTPNGTYYTLVDFSEFTKLDDVNFAKMLTEKYQIAGVPLSGFSHNVNGKTVIRFHFAKEDKTLYEVLGNLRRFVNENEKVH
ncbi:MAG: aminotransferase class I/II-fold pyridoxal phosphate-dependent enzyme [Oscillospiraceae bacterium]|jgi:aminotransferase|nr:aminotransferase class I/II-fold pyridoxal phosphate-dependent enzyme [Oscillospiraceae bacterium]